jgi:hypothetical protein
MKFTALLIASLTLSASAFSAVAPNKAGAVAQGSIDRSMKGIDEKGAFDPTQGENAALQRNNKDEVWVPQVNILNIALFQAVAFCDFMAHIFISCLSAESASSTQPQIARDAQHGS